MNMTLRAIKIDIEKSCFLFFFIYVCFILGPEPAINLISLIDSRGAAGWVDERDLG